MATRLGLLALLGVSVGAVGAFVQTYSTRLAGVALPTGTVLALVTIVAMARAAAWWPQTRAGAVSLSLGWLVVTLLMGTTTRSGDLVLTSGTRQIGYLVGGTLLLAAACAFPLLPEDDGVEAPGETVPGGTVPGGAVPGGTVPGADR